MTLRWSKQPAAADASVSAYSARRPKRSITRAHLSASLRDFLAVIESGSISATARKLGVSQPGLTRSLGSYRGHPLAKACSAAVLSGAEWLSNARREATAQALRAIGIPEPGQITECESSNATLTLLAGSDMLAMVQHPFLDMPGVSAILQEIPIAERLPGLMVGLPIRADAPLTGPAAALARLLSEIGRRLLQRG